MILAIAETGSLVVVSNEGNADLGLSLPRPHVAPMGIEKLIPRLDDLPVLLRLLARSALPEGSILAHGVHLSEAQVRTAEERGLWLVSNPRSNEGNRVGFAASLRASSRVAPGTDCYPARMDEGEASLAAKLAARGEE